MFYHLHYQERNLQEICKYGMKTDVEHIQNPKCKRYYLKILYSVDGLRRISGLNSVSAVRSSFNPAIHSASLHWGSTSIKRELTAFSFLLAEEAGLKSFKFFFTYCNVEEGMLCFSKKDTTLIYFTF